MVLHVLDAIAELGVDRVAVVVGHAAERVEQVMTAEAPPKLSIVFVEQEVQRGTGDAALVGLSAFPDDPHVFEDEINVVVLPGDTPLLRSATLAALLQVHRDTEAAATVLTAHMADPTGYGRIVRGKADKVVRVVEHADATPEELAIDEINTGIFVFRQSYLAPALRRLSPENAQGEYYLPDVVAVLAEAGHYVGSVILTDAAEAAGVNDRVQLAAAEAEMRRRVNLRWLQRGVTMLDPSRVVIEASVELAADVTIFPDSWLQGATVVGAGAQIGPSTRLVDSHVGEGAIVEQTVARQAAIGARSHVGPFAVLEPGSSVSADAITGPHVHLK
jgi:bifunctional UDP-N-acetylglucosamine pyrophosphorylase/glucosamine-1-phosphate N-acetyltransferase